MKTVCVILMLALALSGCAASEVYETLGNAMLPVVAQQPQSILLELPDDAAVSVCDGKGGKLYTGDGYEVCLETLRSGDLDGTLRAVTGFRKDKLTLLQTKQGSLDRYSCAWTAAGEAGDTVGRCAILDDGLYHYCLVVTAAAEKAGKLGDTIGQILASFGIAED